jgi:hypothetical protein
MSIARNRKRVKQIKEEVLRRSNRQLSESSLMLRQAVSRPVCLGPLGLTTRFLLLSHSCGFVDVGRSLLTRGRICRLKLLLSLANVVILEFESRATCDHILLPQIRDFPLCRLLRLAGLRWRYSTPPPHGISNIYYSLKL